jgi:signal recognition particle subunit SRP54
MGDVVTLVEKAQETIDLAEAEQLEKKLRREAFTLEDFYKQLQQIKKMGPLDSVLKMIPGVSKAMKGIEVDEAGLSKVEAMILSMTPEERRSPQIIDGSRRRRIADGSGNSVQDVNRLLKQFSQMRKMIKQMQSGKMKGFMPGMFGR